MPKDGFGGRAVGGRAAAAAPVPSEARRLWPLAASVGALAVLVAARAFLGPQSGDLYVDLPGVVTRLPGDLSRGRGRMIRGVRTTRAVFAEGPGVRSRIYLRGSVGYKLRTVGNRTIVDIYYGGRKFS